MADWKGFPARREESKKRGKLRGIGLANYIETPVGSSRPRGTRLTMPERAPVP